MGIQTIEVDGNNVFKVIKAYQQAKKYITLKKNHFLSNLIPIGM